MSHHNNYNDNVDVAYNLKRVLTQIEEAVNKRSKDLPQINPRLVAATKIKPPSFVVDAYENGQRDFGENYVGEFSKKASDPLILEKCKEIRWHFIGHLQSNKINKLLEIPGLHMIQTLHSVKLADGLNKQWPKYRKGDERLKVMVQVNTSDEDAKSGVEASQVAEIVEHVLKNCPYLEFCGLMTIGRYDYGLTLDPNTKNPDFLTLAQCRQEVCEKFNLDINDVELSMGMTNNFQHAIELGATTVRVGQSIFGPRPPKHLRVDDE